jgi:superfamily II DNA or RNA helicase
MSRIKLRKWQEQAGRDALKAFASGQEVWVTEACTGSGKTIHGVDTASRVFAAGSADLLVVVTPSVATRKGWIRALTNAGFSATDNPDYFTTGDFDALVITYAGRSKLESALYHRAIYKGIFFVVDEYHHGEEDAAWGQSVSVLNDMAVNTLFLSGTPWRSSGQIAVLARHKNRYGQPYYNGDRVDADFKYQYRDDLQQPGDDRGTVTVEFAFQDSQYTDDQGKVDELINPHLSKMQDEEREAWITEALKSDKRIGRHVRTQHGGIDYSLSGNPLVRDLIELGCVKLDRHRVKSGSGVPVLLVVAQNIKEASAIHQYLINVKGLRSALIVSDRDEASDEITSIEDKAKGALLDVIVSVGMVSEGVDIPQIKGVVFLSGIMTLLYIIQVVGRLLRRIRINDCYMDSSVNHLPGFVVAPSAPKLIACAYRIETEISEAARGSKEGGPIDGREDLEGGAEKPEPPAAGVVSTTGDIEAVYRGSEDHAEWKRAIEAMLSHDRAETCHVSQAWAEWILSMILTGSRDAWQEARRQAEDRCDCLGVSLSEMLSNAVTISGKNLSMEQQHKLASREAEALRSRIRWTVMPYREVEDSSRAYRDVNRQISKVSGLRGSFTNASIDEKRRWIQVAQGMLQEVAA